MSEEKAGRKQSEMVAEVLEKRLTMLDTLNEVFAKTRVHYKKQEVQKRIDMLEEQTDQLVAWMRELKDLEDVPLPEGRTKAELAIRSHNVGDRRRIMEVFRIREKKWKAEDKRYKREVGA